MWNKSIVSLCHYIYIIMQFVFLILWKKHQKFAYCIRRHLASYTGYGVSHYSDKPVSQALLNDSSDKPISHTLLKDSIDGKVSLALLWTRWTIVEGDDYLDSLSNRLWHGTQAVDRYLSLSWAELGTGFYDQNIFSFIHH